VDENHEAAAEAGSLSAAARRQKTPLATVSRKVSELSMSAFEGKPDFPSARQNVR